MTHDPVKQAETKAAVDQYADKLHSVLSECVDFHGRSLGAAFLWSCRRVAETVCLMLLSVEEGRLVEPGDGARDGALNGWIQQLGKRGTLEAQVVPSMMLLKDQGNVGTHVQGAGTADPDWAVRSARHQLEGVIHFLVYRSKAAPYITRKEALLDAVHALSTDGNAAHSLAAKGREPDHSAPVPHHLEETASAPVSPASSGRTLDSLASWEEDEPVVPPPAPPPVAKPTPPSPTPPSPPPIVRPERTKPFRGPTVVLPPRDGRAPRARKAPKGPGILRRFFSWMTRLLVGGLVLTLGLILAVVIFVGLLWWWFSGGSLPDVAPSSSGRAEVVLPGASEAEVVALDPALVSAPGASAPPPAWRCPANMELVVSDPFEVTSLDGRRGLRRGGKAVEKEVGAFCIDDAPVKRPYFRDWATQRETPLQPTEGCSWNDEGIQQDDIVRCVTWVEATLYCQEREPAGTFRLPRVLEWEALHRANLADYGPASGFEEWAEEADQHEGLTGQEARPGDTVNPAAGVSLVRQSVTSRDAAYWAWAWEDRAADYAATGLTFRCARDAEELM